MLKSQFALLLRIKMLKSTNTNAERLLLWKLCKKIASVQTT